MNVALWIAAGVLATVLLISTSKAFVPREKIAAVGRPRRAMGRRLQAPVRSGPSRPSNSWLRQA
jgi:hypothetical protein